MRAECNIVMMEIIKAKNCNVYNPQGEQCKDLAACIKDQDQEFVASSVIHQIQDKGGDMIAIFEALS